MRLCDALLRPKVAARNDAGGTRLRGKIGQRDNRGELPMWHRIAQRTRPDILIAMEHLISRSRPALEHMADVKIIIRARWPQEMIAQRRIERVKQNLLYKRV